VQEPEEKFRSSSKTDYPVFGHPHTYTLIDNRHTHDEQTLDLWRNSTKIFFFFWKVQEPEERFRSSSKTDYPVFGHVAKIDDGHITYAHSKHTLDLWTSNGATIHWDFFFFSQVQEPEERFRSSSNTDYPVFGHVAKIDTLTTWILDVWRSNTKMFFLLCKSFITYNSHHKSWAPFSFSFVLGARARGAVSFLLQNGLPSLWSCGQNRRWSHHIRLGVRANLDNKQTRSLSVCVVALCERARGALPFLV